MRDPDRLLSASSDLERELLRSADVLDVPPSGGKERAYALVGIASVAAKTGVAGLGAGSIAPKATGAGALVVTKWLAIGVVSLGAASAGVVYATRPEAQPAVVPSAAIASRPVAPRASVAPSERVDVPAEPPMPVTLPTPETRPTAPPTVPAPARARTAAPAADHAPTSGPTAEVAAPSTPAAVPHAETRTEPPPIAAAGAAGPSPTASVATSLSALREEVASLDRIRELLRAGRAADALRALDEHERRFSSGRLTQEATVLRIEALAARGQRDAAADLARRFLAANPKSSHADHIRALHPDAALGAPRE